MGIHKKFTQMPLTNRIQCVMLLEGFFQHHGLFFREPQFLPPAFAVSAATIIVIAPPRARRPLSRGHQSSIIVVPLAPLAAADA